MTYSSNKNDDFDGLKSLIAYFRLSDTLPTEAFYSGAHLLTR